jgi:hypothetical protein
LEPLAVARGKLKFRQKDIERALRAVKRVGIEAKVVIELDGSISIMSIRDEEADERASEWDTV